MARFGLTLYTEAMQIKSPEVYSMIEAIGHHFKNNISNRFTRGALSLLVLDNATWNQIEELTEKTDNYRYQGYHLDELYGLILAMARFISAARKQVAQTIRYANVDRLTNQDKVLRDMVVNNFGSNLNILADSLNKLYIKIVDIDKENSAGRPPTYTRFPELNELGRYLVG